MRPAAVLLTFALFATSLFFTHAAFAALEETITPTPQGNPNADTSLSRSVDLSLPGAGVTDSQSPLDDSLDNGGSDSAGAGSATQVKLDPNLSDAAKSCIQKEMPKSGAPDDNCIDESVTISQGTTIDTITGYNGNTDTCSKPNTCSAKQNDCGTVTYTVDDSDSTKTISKCDPNYQQELADASANMGSFAAQSIAQQAISNIDPTTSAGQQQLTQALQNLGVSQEDAQAAVASDPDQVKDLLTNIAEGNSSIAQEDAQSLDLNSDVVNNISQLQPSNLPSVLNGVASPDQVDSMNQAIDSGNTFSQPGDQTQSPLPGGKYGQMFADAETQNGLPSGYLAGVAKIESGGDPSICATTSSACGLFQYTSSTWDVDSARINDGVPLPLADRFDPQIATDVTAAAAGYYLQNNADLIDNSGMDPDAALYTFHNLGIAGGPEFISAFAANPDAPVSSAVSATAIANNPGLYGDGSISLAQAQQNMLNAMSGSTNFTGATTNTGVIASESSPFTSITEGVYGGGSVVPTGTAVSPLATVSYIPAAAQQTASSFTNSLLPLMLMSSMLNNSASQSAVPPPPPPQPAPVQTTPTQTTAPQTTASGQTTSVTPIDSITAQPAIVIPGNPIYLGWSSAGVASSPPCQITANGSAFAQGGSGSTTVPTTSSTPVGKITFAISCTAASGGQTLQQSASVIIN